MVAHALRLNVDGIPISVRPEAFSLNGFRAWLTSDEFPSGMRATFYDGEVFLEMSPESLESHNKVKGAVSSRLYQIVVDEKLGESYQDGTLLTHTVANLSTEPDFIFATWDAFRSGKLREVSKAGRADEFIELEGTPELVVEVVSDSSVRKDTEVLRAAYAVAGIAEYWLIDARGDALRFEILSLRSGGYAALSAPDGPQHSGVLGRSFHLRRERNVRGRWTYELDVVRE
ncbi:MAG: Uma2 family endonuclease [Myxococcota bacterium]